MKTGDLLVVRWNRSTTSTAAASLPIFASPDSSFDSEIVCEVCHGDLLIFAGDKIEDYSIHDLEWLRVITHDGRVGWIDSLLIKPV